MFKPLKLLEKVFKKDNKNEMFQFVSLGCNCLPRRILTETNLMKNKSQGQLSCPFDLCVTFPDKTAEILKNNFADYLDNIVFNTSKNCYYNTKYDVYYTHDEDCQNNDDGYKKLINRYRKRIENFQTLIKSDNNIIFILNNYYQSEKVLNNLYESLKKINRKKFFLIVLDLENKVNKSLLNKSIIILQIQHPFEHIDHWYYPENLNKFNALRDNISSEIIAVLKEKSITIQNNIQYTYDKSRAEIYINPINIDADDPRAYFIKWINENAKVLDIGCACGELGEKLKELKNARVTGLEYNAQSIKIAESLNAYKNIIQCDLNKYKNIPLQDKKFDYIIFGDVLEHIYEPENVLNHFKQYLKEDGCFLLSIPNIAHASIKANLLLNNFDYTPIGLLDKTHIRFFTYKTIIKLLSELNLEIDACKLTHYCGINGFQPNNPYPDLTQDIKEFIFKDKHSAVVQYVIKCRKSTRCDCDLSVINLEKIQSELDKLPADILI